MPSKGKKWREKSKKRGKEKKRKVKVKTAVSLLKPNFAFCVRLNFASYYFAHESQGHKVYYLQMALCKP